MDSKRVVQKTIIQSLIAFEMPNGSNVDPTRPCSLSREGFTTPFLCFFFFHFLLWLNHFLSNNFPSTRDILRPKQQRISFNASRIRRNEESLKTLKVTTRNSVARSVLEGSAYSWPIRFFSLISGLCSFILQFRRIQTIVAAELL